MSKKVDIDRLIEDKVTGSDISTSLTLENILSEIDSVMEFLAGGGAEQVYGSKLPQEFEEGGYHNVATDNPFLASSANRDEIIKNADTEGGSDRGIGLQQKSKVNIQQLPEKQNIKIVSKSIKIPLPDIISMVLSSSKNIEKDSRKLLIDIIESAGGGTDWINKINALNNYFSQINNNTRSMNFRNAISKLIILDTMRYLVQELENKGTAFEYIMAPIFGSDCKVVGALGDIPDITCNNGEFSLKFLKSMNSEIGGSWINLKAKPEGVLYVVGVYTDVGIAFYRATLKAVDQAVPVSKKVTSSEYDPDATIDKPGIISIHPRGGKTRFGFSAGLMSKASGGKPVAMIRFPTTDQVELMMKVIAGDLTVTIANVLNNFQQLNTNLIQYFATQQQNPEQTGKKCIQNANNISNGIADISKRENNR